MTVQTQGVGAENIYGHQKRLNWIRAHISKADKVIEYGCGTGYMITLPLAKEGYQITGLDSDHVSIDYGKELLEREGLSAEILQTDLEQINEQKIDVIIASEVLEHLDDDALKSVMEQFHSSIAENGLLLITVPNGYGLFEIESFLWFKTGLGKILTRIPQLINKIGLRRVVNSAKKAIHNNIDQAEETIQPSTLAESPHVQRFTRGKLKRLLNDHGFQIVAIHGSVFIAGPFSNLLLGGFDKILKLNSLIATRFPGIAAGYYVEARKKSD